VHRYNPNTTSPHVATTMMLFGRLRPVYFFAAFAVGLLFCYLVTPPPEIVVKFPSPFNAGRVTYQDRAQNCFQFDASKVSCPKDRGLVKPQPIMEDFSRPTTHQLQQV
jgi:hypothetical protein